MTLGARIRLATGTVVSGGSIQARTTPEWNGGNFAAGVMIEPRTRPRSAAARSESGDERGDPHLRAPRVGLLQRADRQPGTVVDGNALADVSGVAVHLHRARAIRTRRAALVVVHDILLEWSGTRLPTTRAPAP